MKKLLSIFMVLVMVVALLTGCKGNSSETKKQEDEDKGSVSSTSAEPIKVKVGVLAAMTALPVVDIVNNGVDKENGIEVELVSFTTGAPMNEAMAAGQIDVSFIGAAAVFALANSNSKMISEICNDTVAINLVARADSSIVQTKGSNPDYPEVYGSAEALKDTTILCPAGTLSQYEVGKYLSVFGLTMDDVQFVPMDYAQAYQAFKTGQGDIVATRSPQSFTAVDEEGWVTIADLTQLKASATAQIVVSDKAYNDKFDALVTLVKLIHEENSKLNDDVDYAAELMVNWFDKNGQTIDLETAKKQLEAKPFYTTDDVKLREFGKDFKETLLDFMITSGQLDASLKDTVNNNVKSEVIEAAGLK